MIYKSYFPSSRLFLLSISILSMIVGLVMLIFKQKIFQSILHSQLKVAPGTASYNAWLETSIPVYSKIYFFDMLNPRDLFYNHEKPIVEERGPYTFRTTEKKVDIEWHSNGTVTFRKQKYWYFERNMSVGELTDVITTINVPVIGSAEFSRGSYFMEWGISDLLSTMNATIFVKKTVGELLFEGYQDSIIDIGSTFGSMEAGFDEDTVALDKFGWFYKRNGTTWADGKIEMKTGEDDINNLGKIVKWNDATSSPAYEGECGKLRGSSDGLFPPGVAEVQDTLTLYSTDLCRALNFTKVGPHNVHGIPVTMFSLDPNNFSNSTRCPDNECFQNNLPSGVQNVTQCKLKSPGYVSRPHFYLADQSYLQQFQHGVRPDPSKHKSVFWVEPRTSIPFKVEIRLQLNILLRKIAGIEYLFKDVPEVMFPVLWFESVSDLPEHLAGPLNMLILLPEIIRWSGVLSIISSIIFLLILVWQVYNGKKKNNPPGERIERNQTILKETADYEYCKVPLKEACSDKESAESESCSLKV